jgi:hypothetical protein
MSRRLKAIFQKLRQEVSAIMVTEYGLSHSAVEECVEEIAENSEYSILEAIDSV